MSNSPCSDREPICTAHPEGAREWQLDGVLHREDGPAVEYADGTREWWDHGKRHRLDGPAVEWRNGDREWWKRGRRHRADGPAIEDADGTREWYVCGQRHREDGPAIERPDGTREWWVAGRPIPWALPSALFTVPAAREELTALGDPATQREAALRWADRLPSEVWHQVCVEALANEHDPGLRHWGLRALGSRTLVPADGTAPPVGAPSADPSSPRQR